jgi:hypothetical protein
LFFKLIQVNIVTRAPVAQGIEQRTSNPLVVGSIPTRRTNEFKGSRDFIAREIFYWSSLR